LGLRNIETRYQVKVGPYYKRFETGKEFFLDMLVENKIIIEVKSCEDGVRPVHLAQLLSCLKLADKKLGFLLNFNVPLIKDGFRRLVNNYFP
jgi:GxxExxY protein